MSLAQVMLRFVPKPPSLRSTCVDDCAAAVRALRSNRSLLRPGGGIFILPNATSAVGLDLLLETTIIVGCALFFVVLRRTPRAAHRLLSRPVDMRALAGRVALTPATSLAAPPDLANYDLVHSFSNNGNEYLFLSTRDVSARDGLARLWTEGAAFCVRICRPNDPYAPKPEDARR